MSAATDEPIKLLLVGPCPPPHGGISVHVASARRLVEAAGARCEVVDVAAPTAPPAVGAGGRGGRLGAWLRRLARVRRRARQGWTLHLHTNGHNPKSWLVALACGRAARRAPGRVVTLHSGMVPAYLAAPGWRGAAARALARRALAPYGRILAVNPQIRAAVLALGVPARRLAVAPAYLPAAASGEPLPEPLERWLGSHTPVISTALFFRPEYGFDLLIDALVRLEPRHPGLGCLVLGSGEDEAAARRRLAAEGLDGWVHLAGDLPHEVCLALMARSDLFVRPTLADGDALSVREALALGVPVVASDVGTRPSGAALFPAGDLDALVAAIDGALGVHSGPAPLDPVRRDPSRPDPARPDPGERLLRAYREVTA